MSEEMNQVPGAEETGEEVTQETGEEKKLFTQEEVNSFIQSRIAQMKRQASKETNAEIEKRIKDLDAREMRLSVREELEKRGMPKELADVITCSSVEEISTKLDRLNEIYGNKKDENKQPPTGFKIGSGESKENKERLDPIREAMGLNR